MTKSCRKVLNELQKLSSHTEQTFVFYSDTNDICLYENTDKSYNCEKYKDEIFGIINQLVSDGYLKYSVDNSQYYFFLTHKGLQRHQFEWDSFKSFLAKSVIVPIAVSVITTLLTLLIQSLLSMT